MSLMAATTASFAQVAKPMEDVNHVIDNMSFIGWYLIVFVIVGVYEGVILALMPDSFLGIMLGSLILTVLTGVVDIYLTPYFALSECGFYLRATAPEEPPRQDRSSYTPEF